MNGLSLDVHEEEKAVEMFAQNIIKAGEIFTAIPMERPFLPSWNRVVRLSLIHISEPTRP